MSHWKYRVEKPEHIGSIFGRLKIKEQNGCNFTCLCDCGREVTVAKRHVLDGDIKSCGCHRRLLQRTKDIKERYFGRLLVEKYAGPGKGGTALWRCRCICGKLVLIEGTSLLRGNTQSCGCLYAEMIAQKGIDSPLWTGNAAKTRGARNSSEYKGWRKQVLERNEYTCQCCGQQGDHLDVHHIQSFRDHPELRFDPDNGRTLCRPCHKKTSTYGGK